MSTALLTDRYELTMLDAALASGLSDRRASFEVFTRRLPPGRRFGVVAGQGRLVGLLKEQRFDQETIIALRDVVRPQTRDWLTDRELSVAISAYAEGQTYAPHSPVLTVDGLFGEGLLLETLVLSVLNFDSAVASAAARMVLAAGTRPLIDMGSRRTHEQAAVAAARAAYVAGFATTSNLEAGRRHGIPTAGTAAHAFVLAHPSEREAFQAQVAAQGVGTTLLVDTYDTVAGIRTAVDVAGPQLGAIRLDSGDPQVEVPRARALLDELGATGTRIVVTGDLDEHAIERLQAVPVDRFGVGTQLVTGSGAPTAGFVYKLVAIEDDDGRMRPVEKRSAGKASQGSRKWAWRLGSGADLREVLRHTADPLPGAVPLQQPLPAYDDLAGARATCTAALAALPPEAGRLEPGGPAWTAVPDVDGTGPEH
ncbi:MAG: nicotinate phosphoribosyltransferase [Frankiales bacterium]|nr:nicotinate phosphoribosyltransferase [Frankiales bacterium]